MYIDHGNENDGMVNGCMSRFLLASVFLVSGCSSPPPTNAPSAAAIKPPPNIAPLIELFAKRPNDRILAYTIARSYDSAHQSDDVVHWLQTLDTLGFDDALEPADFAFSRPSPAFMELETRFAARALTKTPSQVAFVFDEPDLLAEGVAYDATTKRFFVSSGAKRKILVVDPHGETRDFIAPETGGIFAVLGLEVDEKRRALWAASAAAPFMAHARAEDAGKSALFQFDVDTGALRGRYELPHSPSLANDLALAEDGAVFVSDSIRGTVGKLAPKASTVEEIVPTDSFEGPNGLAIAPDEKGVIVADMFGLSRIELGTNAIRKLEPADKRFPLGGIDGLVSSPNGLIAIQNLAGRGRVFLIPLQTNGDIGTISLLEANHPAYENPTTGEVASDGFYYLANPHYQGRGNAPLTPAAGRKLTMLRLPLP